MKILFSLAYKSLINRKITALLNILTIAICVVLLIGVERIRTQTKSSFANTLSDTDLIVGARSGQVNLLLYSVFRIGNPTNNISWQSYQELSNHKLVKWAIPISLGDSHRNFRVLGTNQNYFDFYRYGKKQAIKFKDGKAFHNLFDVVIGSEVARQLGYKLNDEIIIAHGISDVSFARHDNLPFKISGILATTGTPVDRTVHVSLEAIEAIHVGFENGTNIGATHNIADLEKIKFEPKEITAFFLGLDSKIQTFSLQRLISNYNQEPLSAILPGIALYELWDMMSIAEDALAAISMFVVIAGLLGMLSTLLTSLQERRREMAILRAMGARAKHIFSLIIIESSVLTFCGIATGLAILYFGLFCIRSWILSNYGLFIELNLPNLYELLLLGFVQFSGVIVGFIPAWQAYRLTLSDGMTIRV